MKKKLRHIKKIVFKRLDDYTYKIYLLRLTSLAWTWIITFINSFNKSSRFNKEKRIYFHTNKNSLYKIYLKELSSYEEKLNSEFNEKFLKKDRYDFNGIYLPLIKNTTLLRGIYDDVFKIYTEKNDDYSYKIIDVLEKKLSEGTYCYSGPNGEDITIHKDDVVIDAGAWAGDFSAYASKKGAHVFAFEPSPANIELLQKTIEYNKGNGGDISIVPYGLAEKNQEIDFFENLDELNTGGNSFNISEGKGNIKLQVTTLDNWSKENNIKKIDFIKSDIEGYERKMLLGAKEVLKKFQPTLSICTYHLDDDPEVLAKIIMDSNPNYKILQRKMKLFAYVPNKK